MIHSVDGSGNTTATYGYDVFGAIRSETGAGAGANEWRFTGEQRDPQGSRQFYSLRARYYDPAIGRFLSQDPLPTGNLYAYSFNNPTNWTDPSGRLPGIGTVVGAAAGAVAGGGATLAVDLLEDGKINKSWEEYAVNTARGALIGGLCASAGALCVGLVTFASAPASDRLLGSRV